MGAYGTGRLFPGEVDALEGKKDHAVLLRDGIVAAVRGDGLAAERAQGVREAFSGMDDVCVNLEHDLLGQSMPPESKAGISAYAEIPAVC